MDPFAPERAIREHIGYDGPIRCFAHHRSHAAQCEGREGEIDLFDEVSYPDSLGLFYSALTRLLGFRVNGGEYKVMGLAAASSP